jgi:hypothetical protein
MRAAIGGASVNQEEEYSHSSSQRGVRPVAGFFEVGFQLESRESRGLIKQSFAMFVVLVMAIRR